MNALLLSILLWIWDNRSFERISANNRAIVIAEQAYQQQNYELAIKNYQLILHSSFLTKPEIRLNLANALFKTNQLKQAQKQYSYLTKLNNPVMASQAQMQLALIEIAQKDTAIALIGLKKSLKINPENNLSRFNFEILKRQYSGKMSIKQPKASSELTQASNELQMANVQISETEQKKDILQRLNSMKMTEEQATMILDAMQTSEVQYLQQRHQKPTNVNNGRW